MDPLQTDETTGTRPLDGETDNRRLRRRYTQLPQLRCRIPRSPAALDPAFLDFKPYHPRARKIPRGLMAECGSLERTGFNIAQCDDVALGQLAPNGLDAPEGP